VDLENHLDLLSGRITFNRSRAKGLIEEYLSRQACCDETLQNSSRDATHRTARRVLRGSTAGGVESGNESDFDLAAAEEFFQRALDEDLGPEDVFRITTTSFMDAYNFDVRQLMKSCVHHVLPSGHIIPFSAYNVLYREGHVPLPELEEKEFLPQRTERAQRSFVS